MNKENIEKELSIGQICQHYGLNSYGAENGMYFIPQSYTWSEELEYKLLQISLTEGWQILYQENQVTFIKGKQMFSAETFLGALTKKLNSEKVKKEALKLINETHSK